MNFATGFRQSNRSWSPFTAERQRGWALVSVLWTVALLAILAAALQGLMVASWRLESRAMRAAVAEAALDAAINRAVVGISDPLMERRWRVDGVPEHFAFGGADIRVVVQDDRGLIDLNTADESLIRQLLKNAGLTDDKASALVDKILDWRSETGLRRMHGASDADYRAQGYPYHQRHGPFRTVDELKLVMDMTPALFDKIVPALTVHSKSAAPDPMFAPREVLLALNNNDGKFVNALLDRRLHERIVSDDLPTTVPPGIVDPTTPLDGRSYVVAAHVTLEGRMFARQATVEFTGNPKQPIFFLDWQ